MRKELIREPNLYGERFINGDRMAEAVRCYAGEWDIFRYRNGKMMRTDRGEGRTLAVRQRLPYRVAVAMAKDFAQGNVSPN